MVTAQVLNSHKKQKNVAAEPTHVPRRPCLDMITSHNNVNVNDKSQQCQCQCRWPLPPCPSCLIGTSSVCPPDNSLCQGSFHRRSNNKVSGLFTNHDCNCTFHISLAEIMLVSWSENISDALDTAISPVKQVLQKCVEVHLINRAATKFAVCTHISPSSS